MLNDSNSRENLKFSTDQLRNNVDSDKELVEMHSVAVKIVFVCVAIVSLVSSLTAILVMQRTKKTPYASKFLSTGLLTFDVLFILSSTIRKFVSNQIVSLNIQTFVTLNLQLSVFTVSIMSLERYFLILTPMWYVKYVNKHFIRKMTLLIWFAEVSLCLFVRYGVCYMRYRSVSVFSSPGYCNGILTIHYAVLVILVLTTSCTCYWKIFKCIRSKVRSGNAYTAPATTSHLRNYRSTSLVFVYLIVIIFASVGYGMIILFITLGILRFTSLRLTLEVVSICNCILDPFLYVLWFKDCRFQLLKCLAVFCKRYEQKVEQMRLELYDIVTIPSKQRFATNITENDVMPNALQIQIPTCHTISRHGTHN